MLPSPRDFIASKATNAAISLSVLGLLACGTITPQDVDAGKDNSIDANKGTAEVPDAGPTPEDDNFEFADTEHDFGSVVVGQVSTGYSATITNIGDAGVVAAFTVLTGDAPEEFEIVQDTCNNRDIEPGGNCSVVIEFQPTRPGSSSASILIGAEGSASASMALTGAGLNRGNITISPTPHDFGDVQIGESARQQFTISNTGDIALEAPTVELPESPDFSISENGCESPIAGASSCTIAVEFQPTLGGDAFGSLALTSGDESTTASLKGTGTSDIIVTKTGTGSGTVSGPASLDCGTACSVTVREASITLSQTAAGDSLFQGWSDASCGANADCELPIDAGEIRVSAAFARLHVLTVASDGSGSGTLASVPAGINCGASCSASFVQGTTVQLTATPDTGSVVSGWRGCDSASGSSCTVTTSSARAVTATFTRRHVLTVQKTGSGTGTIISVPAAINCGATCNGTFDSGASVTLTATAASGSVFTQWTNCDSTNGSSCTVSIDQAKIVTAGFTRRYVLRVQKTGSGTGTVISVPAAINCGATCNGTFDSGASVTLTATAASGSVFTQWTNCDSTNGSSCTVSIDRAKIVTAGFTRRYVLTALKTGSGTGSVVSVPAGVNCGATCAAAFDSGSSVTLTASPGRGSVFGGWTGCDSTNGNACTVSIDRAKTVTARFTLRFLLTVSKTGSGSGTIRSTPAGINCGAACSASFDSGTSVTLTATAARGDVFTSWSGCDSSNGASCTVAMDRAKTVTATFTSRYLLTVTKSGSGNGTVNSSPSGIACGRSCRANYDSGTTVTLTASADANSRFVGWRGPCAPSTSRTRCVVTMSAATAVTAVFNPNYVLTVSTGLGSVSVTPPRTTCTSRTCTYTYSSVTSVTLSASGNTANCIAFSNWTGACARSTSSRCALNVNASMSTTAVFSRIPRCIPR